jgi:hypothetical protein
MHYVTLKLPPHMLDILIEAMKGYVDDMSPIATERDHEVNKTILKLLREIRYNFEAEHVDDSDAEFSLHKEWCAIRQTGLCDCDVNE